jgi:hypothetical protein
MSTKYSAILAGATEHLGWIDGDLTAPEPRVRMEVQLQQLIEIVIATAFETRW